MSINKIFDLTGRVYFICLYYLFWIWGIWIVHAGLFFFRVYLRPPFRDSSSPPSYPLHLPLVDYFDSPPPKAAIFFDERFMAARHEEGWYNWFYDSPPPNQRFSLTNVSWLLNTRKNGTKTISLQKFLFANDYQTITSRWHGAPYSRICGRALVSKRAISLKKSWEDYRRTTHTKNTTFTHFRVVKYNRTMTSEEQGGPLFGRYGPELVSKPAFLSKKKLERLP